MLRFKVHQLQLGGKYYILLPKLSAGQVGLLRERFSDLGYEVESKGLLSGRSRKGVIQVDPSGLCWSASDPADAVLPAMPALLACPKETIPAGALKRLYYAKVSQGSRQPVIRFLPRMESGPLWRRLRSLGGCGLAPDEHLLLSALLKRSLAPCTLLTDYPTEGSSAKRFGTRTYFVSTLDPSEASATLRAVGERGIRNAYLPRDGLVSLNEPLLPEMELSVLFRELGEWCYFSPSG